MLTSTTNRLDNFDTKQALQNSYLTLTSDDLISIDWATATVGTINLYIHATISISDFKEDGVPVIKDFIV